jgi:hypothetical protein
MRKRSSTIRTIRVVFLGFFFSLYDEPFPIILPQPDHRSSLLCGCQMAIWELLFWMDFCASRFLVVHTDGHSLPNVSLTCSHLIYKKSINCFNY